ncbi:MAG: cell division protein FtsL [Woeseiaceae bacterium]|jgi:cell division protein FtsL|tara:strand:- start:18787 stop:19065 length:279 start_codon:yes stop_codon:yes gene_type:complete
MDLKKSYLQLLMCIVLCIFSAVAIIYIKHQSRELFIELEALNAERDKLNIQWSELKTEENVWATPMRIEREAINKLNLQRPPIKKIKVYEKR